MKVVLFLFKFYWFIKTFNIMAKIELRLIDCTTDKRYCNVELVDLHQKQAIKVNIYDLESNRIVPVILDKSTAIKFAKTIRTEINKIEEVKKGGDNG